MAQIRNRAVASSCHHRSLDAEAYGNLDLCVRAPRFIGWSALQCHARALCRQCHRPHASLDLVRKLRGPKIAADPRPCARRRFRRNARRACGLRGAFGRRLAATALSRMPPAARVGALPVRPIENGSVEPFFCESVCSSTLRQDYRLATISQVRLSPYIGQKFWTHRPRILLKILKSLASPTGFEPVLPP